MTDLINVLFNEKGRAEQSLATLNRHWRDMPGFIHQNQYLVWKLARIEDAIKRYNAGKLGACLLCGQPIEAERLKKIPYTEHCFNCREQVELLIDEFERTTLIPTE